MIDTSQEGVTAANKAEFAMFAAKAFQDISAAYALAVATYKTQVAAGYTPPKPIAPMAPVFAPDAFDQGNYDKSITWSQIPALPLEDPKPTITSGSSPIGQPMSTVPGAETFAYAGAPLTAQEMQKELIPLGGIWEEGGKQYKLYIRENYIFGRQIAYWYYAQNPVA